MFTFTARRLLFAVPTLLAISFIIFAILDLSPGDPTGNLPLTIPPEVREQIRASLGLNQPFPIRYLLWCQQFFINEPLNIVEQWTGWQFGDGERLRVISWSTRAPVVDLIVERMPQTLWVVGMSQIIAIIIAVPIGVISAYRQYSLFDQLGGVFSIIGFSVPTFFTGLLFIYVFSVWLGWLPSVYDTTLVVESWASFWQQIKQMIMPTMVLALATTASLSRFMRASMLDNLNQDYVRTARAKGLSRGQVLWRHALRNALIPVLTIIGLQFSFLLAGAIIIENVFFLPGLGRLLFQGITQRDLIVVESTVMLLVFAVVVVTFLVDLAYALVDPRLRR
ncbi:MAG: ABC transporter permease [Pseudomonadota bacterium]